MWLVLKLPAEILWNPVMGSFRAYQDYVIITLFVCVWRHGFRNSKERLWERVGQKDEASYLFWTHTPSLLLKFCCFFSVSNGSLHETHWLVHVVLNPINHATLCWILGDEERSKKRTKRKGGEKKGREKQQKPQSLSASGEVHTFRALLWYLTAFLVSSLAASTWSTALPTFTSMLSTMLPWNIKTNTMMKTQTLYFCTQKQDVHP